MITICYTTNRRKPRIGWFFDSLYQQWDGTPIKIVVVDFYAEKTRRQPRAEYDFLQRGVEVDFVPPMPNVWQGPHRLTTQDYFAASVSRNTGLCYADDGYIVYVDDLSVLLPGWFQQVKQAAQEGWIACGAYAKVPKLQVEDGLLKSFSGVGPFTTDPFPGRGAPHLGELPLVYPNHDVVKAALNLHPSGFDNRWKHTPYGSFEPHPCSGNWLYGASCAIPVEGLLKIGGWDWRANAMGSEDYLCGLMLEKHGYSLKYCKRMMTLESDEAHGEEPPFKRIIKGAAHGPEEKNNASWRLLNMVMNDPKPVVPDNFGDGGIRALRQRILAGEPFPIFQTPEHDWYDGQPLKEM